MDRLLEEVKVDYEKNLRAGTVDMMVLRPPEPKNSALDGDGDKDYQVQPAPTM